MVKHQRFAMQKTATSRFKAAQRPHQTEKGVPKHSLFCLASVVYLDASANYLSADHF